MGDLAIQNGVLDKIGSMMGNYEFGEAEPCLWDRDDNPAIAASAEKFVKHLFEEMETELGGRWDFEADPVIMAQKMIAHIDKKRKALGIDKARERVLYDMEMRRELDAV